MTQNPPKVFICHASEDKLFTLDLAKKLLDKGVDAWVDHFEMGPGDKLVEKIFEEGIKNAEAAIIILSKISVKKTWVREEIDAAFVKRVQGKMKLIPVVIDNCDSDIPLALQSTVWEKINDTHHYEIEFIRILNAIFGISNKPPIGQPPSFATINNPVISGIAPQDSLIMAAICESSIRLNRQWIGVDEIRDELIKKGISEEEIRESIEILNSYGFVKGTDEGMYFFEITSKGFRSYAESCIPDFNATIQKILVAIINNDLSSNEKITEHFKLAPQLTNFILDILSDAGYLRIMKSYSGVIDVTDITVLGKRAARGMS